MCDPWHALGNRGSGKNDPRAARKRHSDGQSAVLPDRAGGPALHFFPAGSNEEVNNRAGAEVTVEGPPLEGHPVIYESAVPCAPSGMFQAGIVKRMQKVISLSLVKKLWNSALGQGNVGPGKRECANGERPCLLLQGSPPYRVLPRAAGEETEVILVPREEWLDHHSFGVRVACNRAQEDSVTVPEEYLTPGAGVACDLFQEGGTWVSRCDGLSCNKVRQGPRYVEGGRWKGARQSPVRTANNGGKWVGPDPSA